VSPFHALRRHPLAGRLLATLVAAVVGMALAGLVATDGTRAALSYLGGLALAAAAFEFGRLNIRLVSRMAPSMSLAMALLSYGLTVVVLGLVLAAAGPAAADGRAIAAGLVIGVLTWLTGQVAEAWVVQEGP
jgi:hypothetical protein